MRNRYVLTIADGETRTHDSDVSVLHLDQLFRTAFPELSGRHLVMIICLKQYDDSMTFAFAFTITLEFTAS